ncbi:hypothetical protein [Geomicrobium sp. JCM 19039]|uniref:hypothetical protein n=1 Tax=Geomicrobium sp. JCM 19039 TaxID=1460636 RepID=UPI00045F3E81|nr:hypothetical protein [Geomicrobium sp. JCM 19039]GAK10455.1 hypothetical protein JCM19039_68 [Geomicrobium sp. JCM 19039]
MKRIGLPVLLMLLVACGDSGSEEIVEVREQTDDEKQFMPLILDGYAFFAGEDLREDITGMEVSYEVYIEGEQVDESNVSTGIRENPFELEDLMIGYNTTTVGDEQEVELMIRWLENGHYGVTSVNSTMEQPLDSVQGLSTVYAPEIKQTGEKSPLFARFDSSQVVEAWYEEDHIQSLIQQNDYVFIVYATLKQTDINER